MAPAIANVPLVMARNPSALAPSTRNAPAPGVKVRMLALDVPLLIVTPVSDFRLVAPVPAQVLEAAPVNVMETCDAFPFWLKSIVPLLVRLPPMERV